MCVGGRPAAASLCGDASVEGHRPQPTPSVGALCVAARDDVKTVLTRLVWLVQVPSDPAPAARSASWCPSAALAWLCCDLPRQAWRAVQAVNSALFQRDGAASTIGGLLFHRALLVVSWNAHNIWVPIPHADYRIDGVVVPARAHVRRAAGNAAHPAHFLTADGQPAPCVLYCTANGGLYEDLASGSTWLELYNRLGFTVVAYNYKCGVVCAGCPLPQRTLPAVW